MRYLLIRTKGLPPKVKPCGMNDILGIGEYASPQNALRLMKPASQPNIEQGYTHFAIYTFPHGYDKDCELVLSQRLGA